MQQWQGNTLEEARPILMTGEQPERYEVSQDIVGPEKPKLADNWFNSDEWST